MPYPLAADQGGAFILEHHLRQAIQFFGGDQGRIET